MTHVNSGFPWDLFRIFYLKKFKRKFSNHPNSNFHIFFSSKNLQTCWALQTNPTLILKSSYDWIVEKEIHCCRICAQSISSTLHTVHHFLIQTIICHSKSIFTSSVCFQSTLLWLMVRGLEDGLPVTCYGINQFWDILQCIDRARLGDE